MERVCPVLRSSRVMLPFCESTYRIDESLGAGTAYSPSPPVTVNHSEPFKPPEPPPPPPPPTLVDGPHQALLSWRDRKSTRLNSSHRTISYAVFCLKKKK